jgi:hypothetical protein
MPTLLELYESKKDQSFTEGGPDVKTLDAKKYNNLPGGFYSGDQTPYSLGTGYAGKKDIDEEGLKAVEKLNASGNKYQLGELGAGSSFLKNGYTNVKKYGATDRKK